jgi:hypothetical protein
MKLDRLDRVPFLRPGLLEALWTSHIHIPRRSPFNFISVIMPHGMSTCNNLILVGALTLSRVTLAVPAFP